MPWNVALWLHHQMPLAVLLWLPAVTESIPASWTNVSGDTYIAAVLASRHRACAIIWLCNGMRLPEDEEVHHKRQYGHQLGNATSTTQGGSPSVGNQGVI
jgi:hypothetical protein